MPGDFKREILDVVAHRPWPLPGGPWVMTQTWHELLLAHWVVDVSWLRTRVPAALPLDLHDGHAWVSVVPFRMANVTFRGAPAIPGLSAFPELNVRTYVRVDDKPGVFFFSLDATNAAAVLTARSVHLPYFLAAMHVAQTDRTIRYRSRRRVGPDAAFDARYRPCGGRFHAAPGSLDEFLTERYCLYTANRRHRLRRVEIHHPPWEIQHAEVELTVNTMTSPIGLELPRVPDVVHFAQRQDIVAWCPTSP